MYSLKPRIYAVCNQVFYEHCNERSSISSWLMIRIFQFSELGLYFGFTLWEFPLLSVWARRYEIKWFSCQLIFVSSLPSKPLWSLPQQLLFSFSDWKTSQPCELKLRGTLGLTWSPLDVWIKSTSLKAHASTVVLGCLTPWTQIKGHYQ